MAIGRAVVSPTRYGPAQASFPDRLHYNVISPLIRSPGQV